jgi:hypothetical protein
MAKSCPTLPANIQRDYNQLSLAYSKDMPIEQARVKAAESMLDFINAPTAAESFGSTANPNNHHYTATVASIIQNETDIRDVFRELGNLGSNNKIDSIVHTEQLDHVVEDLIIPLADQLKGLAFVTFESDTAPSPEGIYEVTGNSKEIQLRINSIINPFLNRFRLSYKEIAAHEFVHATTTAAYTSGNIALRKGIQSLYNQAKEALKPADFSQTVSGVTTTAAEDQAAYDYIFNNQKGQGVEEFMAFGLTNEIFRKKISEIKVNTGRKLASARSIKDLIDILFEKIINFLTRATFNIKGDNVAKALEILVKELSGVTKKNHFVVDTLSQGLELTKGAGSKTLDQIVRPLTKLAMHPKSPAIIRGSIAALQAYKVFPALFNWGHAVGTTINNVVKHRDYFFWNLVLKLPQELAGMNVTNEAWHNMLRHSKHVIDGARHKIKESTISNIREIIGTMEDDDKEHMTSIFVHGDLDDLEKYNSSFTMADYRKVLSNHKHRQVLIKDLKTQLVNKFSNVGYGYIKQAFGLGMFMQTKQTINAGNQAFNAHTIARGDWDSKFVRPTNWQDAIPLLQQLKTLYSVEQALPQARTAAVKFFDSQNHLSIDEGNGFNRLLSMSRLFRGQSMELLFNNDPYRMVAGYSRDINDPNVMIKYSTNSDDQNLKDLGFVKLDYPLGQDKLFAHPKNYMYVSNNNGLVAFDKKIVSLTSRQLAGTSLTDLLVNEGWDYGNAAMEAKVQSAVILSKINRADMYSKNIDSTDTSSLFPVFDENGNITNHRYVMLESTRKNVLKKDSRIDNVFGSMFESLTDKVESPNVNKMVVEELKKEYQTMYNKSPKGFIVVTKNHPKYGEIYKLLPKEMKADLDVVFGEGRIVVREAMMDIIFGYRKYSLFTQGDNLWLGQMMKKLIVDMFKVSPGKYYRYGRTAEQSWQALINEIKTFIVLKTHVLAFNILSNAIVSFMHGMPLNYMLKKQGEATVAVEDYIVKHRQKLIYEQRLNTINISASAKTNIQAKITQLQADMDNSPIKTLIDKGLLNSIVEDVTLDDSDFGVKGEVAKFLVKKTKWIPKPVKAVYEFGQIGPKTGLYKLLEKTTRYSDFVARHAMYEWYTKEKKMPPTEALKIVTETFVNYELPTSKELQYLNDMGAAMFTKYAVRIQKTIYRMALDNPKSIVGLVVVENMFGVNLEDPTNSLAFFPGMPINPLNSMDNMVAPLYQLMIDILF